MVGAIVGLSWRRRVTRPVFYRTLLREGLTPAEAKLLYEKFNPPIPFREIVGGIEVQRPT